MARRPRRNHSELKNAAAIAIQNNGAISGVDQHVFYELKYIHLQRHSLRIIYCDACRFLLLWSNVSAQLSIK